MEGGLRPQTPLRAASRRLSAAAAFALLLPGCASDLVQSEGRWHHRAHGFAIDDAAGLDSGWQPVTVDGALLAYRAPDGASMSLLLRCDGSSAPARILARQLLIGLPERQLVDEGPVEIDGAAGWRQRVPLGEPGRALELRTVTRRMGRCTLDWVLIAEADRAAQQNDFDRWWSSFRAAPEGDPG